MKKVMISGATGFIGAALCRKLAASGYVVHALYRHTNKTKAIDSPNIILFKGDITDADSLQRAMKGCDYVFHLAAFAQVWAKSKQIFYELNVDAVRLVFETALSCGIKKVVFTSTAGVIGPSLNGEVDESTNRTLDFFSEYERTKNLAENLVPEYTEKGLDITIVNPTRVYGPGELSVSNSVTKMVNQYLQGKFRFLPGNGKSIGNYVFIDDVVNGHLQALMHGKAGERYILGGSNVTYQEFFSILASVSGKKIRMFKLPLSLMIVIAFMMKVLSKFAGIKPLITPGWVRKFNHHWIVSSQKAINELKYSPLSIEEGLQKTVNWIKQSTLNQHNEIKELHPDYRSQ